LDIICKIVSQKDSRYELYDGSLNNSPNKTVFLDIPDEKLSKSLNHEGKWIKIKSLKRYLLNFETNFKTTILFLPDYHFDINSIIKEYGDYSKPKMITKINEKEEKSSKKLFNQVMDKKNGIYPIFFKIKSIEPKDGKDFIKKCCIVCKSELSEDYCKKCNIDLLCKSYVFAFKLYIVDQNNDVIQVLVYNKEAETFLNMTVIECVEENKYEELEKKVKYLMKENNFIYGNIISYFKNDKIYFQLYQTIIDYNI
jgi:hypothetical protein